MALLLKPQPTTTHDDSSQDEFPKRIVLDDASFDAFSAAIANPPRPNAKLRALFRKR
jgi:uncharacterized protein (DUF1778 family)